MAKRLGPHLREIVARTPNVYSPWLRKDCPLAGYLFCTSGQFNQAGDQIALREEITKFFVDLAQSHHSLNHLANIDVQVLGWNDFTGALAANPPLRFRWFGGASALSLGDDDHTEDAASASGIDIALPRPPALAALPHYLGSLSFLGDASRLQMLTNWCSIADPNPMMLVEASRGAGKSVLTWNWLTNHATIARGDWAGRFWYSFHEKGTLMAAFCRQALAYMTERRVEDFSKLRTPELSQRLVAELEKRPWLLVLDGLERILVASHLDAAQLHDEEADNVFHQIGTRDLRAAIRPEDDELLRRLAAAAPSKILISSQLAPLALVSRLGMPVPGVRHEILHGMSPVDAEALIRGRGITGDSRAIQSYLQTNCDCSPLVISVLAGLINDYPPARGNFDRWSEDPNYGGSFNLAELDLLQRRNQILRAAIRAITSNSLQMLEIVALLQDRADFDTLVALAVAGDITETIQDLDRRGLLRYDSKKCELHPIVRNVILESMGEGELSKLRQRIADYYADEGNNFKPKSNAEALANFFLSYSTTNEPIARRVVAALEQGGYSVFAQFKDIPVGSNFVEEMKRGLRAKRLVALLSPDYESSQHCQAEWNAAFADDPSGYNRKLIPLLIEPTELNFLARQVVYANLVGLSDEAFEQRVLDAVRDSTPATAPIENVTPPVRHSWTSDFRLTVGHSAIARPDIGRGSGDLFKQLSTVRKLAQRLAAYCASPDFNHSTQYACQLRAYLEDIPTSEMDGNIYLCDAAARTLREMFASEAAILRSDFTAPLKTFLECHIGVRAHYPELPAFYASVRDGVLVASLPLDFVERVRSAISAHTPTQFDPSVAAELAKEEASAPALSGEIDVSVAPPTDESPQPPPDPIGTVDRAQSRDQLIARSLNGMWTVFLSGKDIVPNIKGWRRAYETLEPAIRPVLDYLRRSLGS